MDAGMRRRGKCALCPHRGLLNTIERGYTKERIKVCDYCHQRFIESAEAYRGRGARVKELADPRQMVLL